jgi:ATP-dependent DNA helicase DinG
MSLQDAVGEVFASGGLLARSIDTFSPRAGQTDMALAVARVMDDGGVLVVEAGTGIGKTFAYLVPVLLSGTRVLLSTATKTLQDQLFGRDLPQLVRVLNLPIRIALLKGRSSYLCLHRLEGARQTMDSSDLFKLKALGKIESWALTSRSGDLAELPGLDERSPLIPLVTSTRENCVGAECPQFRACHVNLARREAMAADIVVINHHLFFADLAVRDSGMAELLPTVKTVIFDEAHQLNETGVQFLGLQLSSGQLIDFSRDLLVHGSASAGGFSDWASLSFTLECAARDLRLLLGNVKSGTKLRWVSTAPEQAHEEDWLSAMNEVERACTLASRSLSAVKDMAPDLMRLSERCDALLERMALFIAPCGQGVVRWLDVGMQLRLVEAPLDIAAVVKNKLIKPDIDQENHKAWIFTSATLGDDPELRWFTEPCGLTDAEILRVSSPFNYAVQSAVYVPLNLPKPSEPEHSAQVAALVARMAPVISGRTLVLTTTLRALAAISDALQLLFRGPNDLNILVQGQLPKRELIERFRNGNFENNPGCILVASASFWEGVDLPGDVLQLLVIDKLPFPPPNDPVVEARSKQIEAMGKSVFSRYFIPEAAIALKQGAGRLIRRESDRGLLVVCDSRLKQMSYGKRLMASLPPMRKVENETALFAELASLTKASTTDQSLF